MRKPAGITSIFFKRDAKFFVNGPDGNLADFEIKYTFGGLPGSQTIIRRKA
jgi:hypothetical protein